MPKPVYITTTLPYVNAEPHIGFAMELIRADALVRAKRLQGHDVFFNTGTDEHGTKIYRKAKELGIEVQAYVDSLAETYKKLIPLLGIAADEEGIRFNFIRTTDPHHVRSAQAFWQTVDKNGYIYKKSYSVKYCVGCELEKTESELANGRCPLHPLQDLERIEEENYFFRFSAFADKLRVLYAANPSLVIPDFRFNEIKAFIERGLEDFSISRLASKMPWGVPVPGDPDQVMYVWFDALVDYISAVGWPDDEIQGRSEPGAFAKWWTESGGVVQYCGKDNLRQQSAMWQAMLMAAELPPSKAIVINGFITGEGGIKMSKSLGNTVNPFDIVREYGTDALRYFVLRELSPFEDSPFTPDKFKEAYNANLANGIGNLTSRIMKMSSAQGIGLDPEAVKALAASDEAEQLFRRQMAGFEAYDLQAASAPVWDLATATDRIIQEREPFKKIKVDRAAAERDIRELVARLNMIATMLWPLLPGTAAAILTLVRENKMPEAPLFARK